MLFVCVFLSIVFGLNCLVMSNLTVEDLNRALEEKLVPLTKKTEETNTAITFILITNTIDRRKTLFIHANPVNRG